jgi:outer membrane protein OmpA-like peptidoglycan-associated protein
MYRRMLDVLMVALVLFGVAGVSSPAVAQTRSDIDTQNFEPALGPHAIFTVDRAGTLGHLEPAAQVYFDYLSEPVVRGSGDDRTAVVDQQLAADVSAGIGLTERGQVGLHMPFYLVNDGQFAGESFSGATVGDLSVQPKYQLVTDEVSPVGLSARLDVTVPTGDGEAFVGAPGVEVDPVLIADTSAGDTDFAANVGASLAQGETFKNIDVGSRLTYGLGVEHTFVDGVLDVGAELYGDTPFGEFFDGPNSPLEGILGAKVRTGTGLVVKAGAGGGIAGGIGAPEFRAFVGVGYPDRSADADGDGIVDSADDCPNEPEDEDGFEDGDGCPEPDNDGDGIDDEDDECPEQPEDKDGFEDGDGCADTDNDGDGVPDAEDECPDEAGPGENDGCPKTTSDSDDDGIPDEQDDCPEEPEDEDGFEDDDGCPDPDNDGDGIADADDECPADPGLEANNGCPAEEKKAVRKDEKIEILEKVYFEYDKAVIKEESYGVLDSVALILRTNPEIETVEIEGHTDNVGGEDYNKQLSESRAEAVKSYLVEEGDIAAERLEATGYGASQPLVPNNSDENRSKNRRVEFKIVQE